MCRFGVAANARIRDDAGNRPEFRAPAFAGARRRVSNRHRFPGEGRAAVAKSPVAKRHAPHPARRSAPACAVEASKVP